jgi:hypothetical protein
MSSWAYTRTLTFAAETQKGLRRDYEFLSWKIPTLGPPLSAGDESDRVHLGLVQLTTTQVMSLIEST